jgi:F0F1-type ATP synthase epsilon subunit
MRLSVLKPNEDLIDAEVDQVTLPGTFGQITPMEGHDRLLSTTDGGLLYFTRTADGEEEPAREEYHISPGIIEVTHHSVTLFVERAERIKGGDLEG